MFAQRKRTKSVLLILGFWIVLCLSGCTAVSLPLRITKVSVSPEPKVGELVTLQVEITADDDEPDVTFTIDTLEQANNKIHLVSGEPAQKLSLTAGKPQAFQFEICVLEEGDAPLRIRAVARHPDGNAWDAFEIIHIESTLETGRLIRQRDYTFSQEEAAKRPTPRPFPVSPECSGLPK